MIKTIFSFKSNLDNVDFHSMAPMKHNFTQMYIYNDLKKTFFVCLTNKVYKCD